MSNKLRVLVCDDHSLFREGVKSILSAQPDIDVIGEAFDGLQAVDLAKTLRPDVVLMDISMPLLKGFDATRRIHRMLPDIKILVLTIHDDEDLVARCLMEGAAGYILKDAPPSQLVYATQAVGRGERYLSPRVLGSVVNAYKGNTERAGQTKYDLLSDREREILVLLAGGDALKEIAQRLNLSVKTVDAHKANLMRKLELHDRSELIRYAIRNKLVEP
ncbi:MAG TPA: response regulator transcription factor [Bryobacteraceae bacterium]|nr:response regulator transcription factor [Bryobacteraceae bacterium]